MPRASDLDGSVVTSGAREEGVRAHMRTVLLIEKGARAHIAASPFLRCQKPRAVSIAASPFLRLGSPRESSREGETARNLDRGCRGRPVRVPEERKEAQRRHRARPNDMVCACHSALFGPEAVTWDLLRGGDAS